MKSKDEPEFCAVLLVVRDLHGDTLGVANSVSHLAHSSALCAAPLEKAAVAIDHLIYRIPSQCTCSGIGINHGDARELHVRNDDSDLELVA
eukprot:scaffold125734_cov22-Tisochrysis_lutea.AAC.2